MNAALHDLALDRLFVVHAGEARYPVHERVEALPLAACMEEICRLARTVFQPLSARHESGLNQAQFPRVLGISVRTLQKWEQGEREMTPSPLSGSD